MRPVTIFTGQWADLPFEKVCELTSLWGYDGLEIACWGDHLDVKKAAGSDKYLNEKLEILEKYNIKVWAIGNHLAGQLVASSNTGRFECFAPPETHGDSEKMRTWAIEEMKASAIAARKLGASVVTGFTGSPIWEAWYSFPPVSQQYIDNGFRYVADLWNPILDVFDENGVKFALEVHPPEIAFDYHTANKLLEYIDRDTFGFNFDPSHLLWQGIEPHLFLYDFASKIYHVHMKDAMVKLDGRSGILGSHITFGDSRRGWDFVSLGHGDVNFELIIRALNDIGYAGPLSVEWEDSGMEREFGAQEALDFVHRVDFPKSALAFDDSMKN